MEELKGRKITKDKNGFTALATESIRDLVDAVHEENILKENIVTIFKDKERYVIFYYK